MADLFADIETAEMSKMRQVSKSYCEARDRGRWEASYRATDKKYSGPTPVQPLYRITPAFSLQPLKKLMHAREMIILLIHSLGYVSDLSNQR